MSSTTLMKAFEMCTLMQNVREHKWRRVETECTDRHFNDFQAQVTAGNHVEACVKTAISWEGNGKRNEIMIVNKKKVT